MKRENSFVVSFSIKNIIIIAALAGCVWLLINLYDVVIALFIAFIISSFYSNVTDWLVKKGVSKNLAIILLYSLTLVFFALIIFLTAHTIFNNFQTFLNYIPSIVKNLTSNLVNTFPQLRQFIDPNNISFTLKPEDVANIGSTFLPNISKTFGVVGSAFWVLFLFITVLTVSFYLQFYKDSMYKNLASYFPKERRPKVYDLFQNVENGLGAWLRGQLLLCLIVGLFSYIGMAIFGIKFALILGILAGIFEIVPNLGPTLFMVVSVGTAAADGKSLLVILLLAAWNLGVQQLENSILVPKVMERVVGLNPIVVIISIIAGGKILGVAGAILAVPTVVVATIIIDFLRNESQERSK